ncbi:MAG: hypothetical protein Q9170_007734 [Blastenia crenularia]
MPSISAQAAYVSFAKPVSDAVEEARWEAREMLPAETTTSDILNQLEALKTSQTFAAMTARGDDVHMQAAIGATHLAIQRECELSAAHLDNLRRLYLIALPTLFDPWYHRRYRERFSTPHEEVFNSFRRLMNEVDDFVVPGIPDKKLVLEEVRRRWRWLGHQTAAPYEPLYEWVTGLRLQLE